MHGVASVLYFSNVTGLIIEALLILFFVCNAVKQVNGWSTAETEPLRVLAIDRWKRSIMKWPSQVHFLVKNQRSRFLFSIFITSSFNLHVVLHIMCHIIILASMV